MLCMHPQTQFGDEGKTLGWRTPYEVFYGLENAA